jgi:hypothetical protein
MTKPNRNIADARSTLRARYVLPTRGDTHMTTETAVRGVRGSVGTDASDEAESVGVEDGAHPSGIRLVASDVEDADFDSRPELPFTD